MDPLFSLASNPWIQAVLTVPVLLFILQVGYAINDRNRLQIGPFKVAGDKVPSAFKRLGELVESEMRRVLQVHQKLRTAAGELSLARDVSLASFSESIYATTEASSEKRLGELRIALSLIRHLFRPPRIRGLVILAGNRMSVTATYESRGSADQALEPVHREPFEAEHINAIARELALKAILARSDVTDIRSPEAFGLLTEALASLPALTINSSAKGDFAETEEKLRGALRLDGNSAFINYNLGLVLYYRYGGEGYEEALKLFRRGTRTAHGRLRYLARIAYARCLAQNYHRLGRQSEAELTEARRDADQALEEVREAKRYAPPEAQRRLAHDEGYALYAVAFSRHATETPEDIDLGVEFYEESIAAWGDDTPAVVYNNLGYILMAKVGRFDPAEGQGDQYSKAAEAFEKALAREGSYKFTLANLGNVERLRGNYRKAVELYEEAIEADPNYANAHNELAWVYVYSGDEQKAREYHAKAIQLAAHDGHKAEIMEAYAHILHGLGRKDEALDLGRRAWPLNRDNTDLEAWLTREYPGWDSGENDIALHTAG